MTNEQEESKDASDVISSTQTNKTNTEALKTIFKDLSYPRINIMGGIIRVLSYNIRGFITLKKLSSDTGMHRPYSHFPQPYNYDRVLIKGHDYSWVSRKRKIGKLISSYCPDIICLQETSNSFYSDIVSMFPNYTPCSHIVNSKYRDITILYKTSIFTSLDVNIITLDEKIYFGSPSFTSLTSASSDKQSEKPPRIAICVELKHLYTGVTFKLINTHFESGDEGTRLISAKIVRSYIQSLPADLKIILCGDLNLFSERPRSREIHQILTSVLTDTYQHIGTVHYYKDTQGTWIGLPNDPFALINGGQSSRLDYIFVRGVNPISDGIITEKIDNCENVIYPDDDKFDSLPDSSDHHPIVSDVII
jgi:endonuclease/exonuclease/phosphatase family metal-dependent hydrolase